MDRMALSFWTQLTPLARRSPARSVAGNRCRRFLLRFQCGRFQLFSFSPFLQAQQYQGGSRLNVSTAQLLNFSTSLNRTSIRIGFVIVILAVMVTIVIG